MPSAPEINKLLTIAPVHGTESESRQQQKRELWGKVVDIFGETVRAQLYEAGKPPVRRSFKKGQLRPNGERAWKATVVKPAEPEAAAGGEQPLPR